MYTLQPIARTLSSPENLALLRQLIRKAGHGALRTDIARRVCEAFGFLDALGQPRLASCYQALRRLDAAGRIQLPPSTGRPRAAPQPPEPLLPVPPPSGLPDRVDLVQGLTVALVDSPSQQRCWRSLLDAEHPLGAVRHAGCQRRYLVLSAHGVLGAFGFSAAALAVDARDRFIGWQAPARLQRLQLLTCLSRCLIRPSARCANLASKALALCLRRLPDDFRRRYGFQPLAVESYVDTRHHDGTSLQAAGFRRVGQTRGRGRFAPPGRQTSVKSVWLLPLADDWRSRLVPEPALPTVSPLEPGAGLGADCWADHEFGAARLGDRRLTRRLVRSATLQATQPNQSFPSLAQGRKSELRGHYRLLDQPDDSLVTPANLLAAHRERSLARMQGQSTVLCVQDGTDFNFANRRRCVGLGLIAKHKHSAGTRGLHLHSTLALSEDGLPLGVLRVEYSAPCGPAPNPEPSATPTTDRPAPAAPAGAPPDSRTEPTRRPSKPPEQRKTRCWIRGLQDCAQLARRLVDVRVVAVLDREADFLRLFRAWRDLGGALGLLVRARHDRALGERTLFALVRAARVRGTVTIDLPPQAARPSSREHEARPARAAREATCQLRWKEVELPRSSGGGGRANVRLQLLQVREAEPPGDGPRLEWLLLTSEPVRSVADALRVLRWYQLRWRIEDWHKVLKSGCGARKVLHRRRRRMERAITIKAVIAWRLMLLAMLGRETPDIPAEAVFSDAELGVLRDFCWDRRLPAPHTFGAAMHALAVLGGSRRHKQHPHPGAEQVWEGYSRMASTLQT